MESDIQQPHYHLHDHHPRQTNPGLTRYQSAPSSYFSSFGDRESLEEFLHRPTSPETERILSRFLQTSHGSNNVDSFLHQSFSRQNGSSSLSEKKQPEIKTEKEMNFPAAMEDNDDEAETMHLKPSGHVSVSQNQRQEQRDDRSANRTTGSNLARHNSSPAGLFASIDVESAYAAVMRSMGDNLNTATKEASSVTPRSRPPPSPSRLMTSISETDSKPCFSSGLPPRTLSGGLNRPSGDTLTAGDRTLSGGLNLSETKDVGSASRPPLAHHRSLPKSLSDIEKLLSDSVPCKIRAKRGCATHPRSIAERVRRTKISERMKKLQDLVPNMDKIDVMMFPSSQQTNTADMLDLAVEYIKDLQGQVTRVKQDVRVLAGGHDRQKGRFCTVYAHEHWSGFGEAQTSYKRLSFVANIEGFFEFEPLFKVDGALTEKLKVL